ncbi:MAG: response regulator [Pseudomonadales bacterium]|nr:response regulator [Pseudomonadales bacterium]
MKTEKTSGQVNSKILTTGEVAKYCGVHFRTVIRWIERGNIKAFKLPGRGDNRIESSEFVKFLKQNDMPIPEEFQSRKKSILIVDDEKEMAAAIQRILKRATYDTAIAQDGFQAGAMLNTFKPDLMTLDLSMPQMDGFAMLEFVRKQEEYKNLKILVISALDDKKLVRAIDAGADQCLTKPFKNKELLNIVAELFTT